MDQKITKRVVDNLEIREKFYYVWDTEIPGFCIKVRNSGVHTYLVKVYSQGRQQWSTIGRVGAEWTPELARQKAISLLKLAKVDNTNLSSQKRSEKQAKTVFDLCELYLEKGCSTKKASTVATDKGRIERHIKPLLGKKKIKEVTRADIQKFLQDVAEGKSAVDVKTGLRGRAIVEGGKGTATRTTGLLGGIFTFAVDQGLCEYNPVRGVKRYKDRKNERYLSEKEIAQIGEALEECLAENKINLFMASAIKLLMLTGCRKSEIASLKWKFVDFERGYFLLPDTKTGEKNIPVGKSVIEVLKKLPRVNDYVFPSLDGKSYTQNIPKAWDIVKSRAQLKDVRLHDLRHTFASLGASAGDSLFIIGKLLGHKDSKTTSRYAHLSDNPLKSAAEKISEKVSGLLFVSTESKLNKLHKL